MDNNAFKLDFTSSRGNFAYNFIDMSLSRKCLLINKIYVKQLIGELNWFLIIHLHQNLAQKNEPLI